MACDALKKKTENEPCQQLKAKIDETNRLARQFNKQNYVDMILKTYQIDPQQARAECKYWMNNHPLVLSDLGVLVKKEINKIG